MIAGAAKGRSRCLRTAAVLVAAGAVAASCGSTDDGAAVAAATAFTVAVTDRDGTAACGLLTEHARSAVGSFGRDCSQVIVGLPEEAGPATTVEVWGDSAQIGFAGDTLFLARFDDGWRVRAAGCRPQPADEPYSCEVEG